MYHLLGWGTRWTVSRLERIPSSCIIDSTEEVPVLFPQSLYLSYQNGRDPVFLHAPRNIEHQTNPS